MAGEYDSLDDLDPTEDDLMAGDADQWSATFIDLEDDDGPLYSAAEQAAEDEADDLDDLGAAYYTTLGAGWDSLD